MTNRLTQWVPKRGIELVEDLNMMNGLWGGLFNHILVYYGKIEIETFIVEV